MIDDYLAADSELVARHVFEGVNRRRTGRRCAPAYNGEFFQMLGLWPLPSARRFPPTGRRAAAVVIEKIHFKAGLAFT